MVSLQGVPHLGPSHACAEGVGGVEMSTQPGMCWPLPKRCAGPCHSCAATTQDASMQTTASQSVGRPYKYARYWGAVDGSSSEAPDQANSVVRVVVCEEVCGALGIGEGKAIHHELCACAAQADTDKHTQGLRNDTGIALVKTSSALDSQVHSLQ